MSGVLRYRLRGRRPKVLQPVNQRFFRFSFYTIENLHHPVGVSHFVDAGTRVLQRQINKKNYVAGIPLFIGIVYVFAVGFQIQYLRYFLPALLLISVSLGY